MRREAEGEADLIAEGEADLIAEGEADLIIRNLQIVKRRQRNAQH